MNTVNIAVPSVEHYTHPAIQASFNPKRMQIALRLQRTWHSKNMEGYRHLTHETPEGWLAQRIVPLFPRKVQLRGMTTCVECGILAFIPTYTDLCGTCTDYYAEMEQQYDTEMEE